VTPLDSIFLGLESVEELGAHGFGFDKGVVDVEARFFLRRGISGVVVGRGAFRHCVPKEEGR
jgi:hypothetical protein